MGRTVDELNIRIGLCEAFLQILGTCEDTPRRDDALRYYREQWSKLVTERDGKPPDIVIGLQPGRIFAKAYKGE